jgi:hypothetical protein
MGFVDSKVARSKHSEVGIFNDENVKGFNFIKILKMLVFTRK